MLSTPPLTAMASVSRRRGPRARASPRPWSRGASSLILALGAALHAAPEREARQLGEIVALGLRGSLPPARSTAFTRTVRPCTSRAAPRRTKVRRSAWCQRRPMVEVSAKHSAIDAVARLGPHQEAEDLQRPALLAGRRQHRRDRGRRPPSAGDRRRRRSPRRSCRRRRRRRCRRDRPHRWCRAGRPPPLRRRERGGRWACRRERACRRRCRSRAAGRRPRRRRRADEMAEDGRAGRRHPLAADAVVAPLRSRRGSPRSPAPGPAGARAASARGRRRAAASETLQRAPRSAAAMLPAATTSMSESQSAISWKWTSSTATRVDIGLGLGEDGGGCATAFRRGARRRAAPLRSARACR